MPFNSLNFALFFLVFYSIYLALLKSYRVQNLWLLAASYVFYAFWDWRFLLVLIAITAVSYLIGLALGSPSASQQPRPFQRRLLLWIGLILNLGTLVFFKYYDFFKPGVEQVFSTLHIPLDPLLVDVILPIGLSFYALQASSYIIDVFTRRLQPAQNLIEFALFIGFFPQLLSGPIERAGRMLPQFHQHRAITPEKVSAGIYLLFSGFFKKLVIADNLGLIVNAIFAGYSSYTGVDLLIAILAFTGQLYADFSAYSDIARGLARLLGFELVVNFRLPYFASTPSEFWSRWHISLSEWLRDYIFFPLRRGLLRWNNPAGKVAGLLFPPLATMLISGVWHGTGWNFIVWGLYHGVLMILFQLLVKEASIQSTSPSRGEGVSALHQAWGWLIPRLSTVGRLLFMFLLVCLGWLIFRVESAEQLYYFLTHLSLKASAETSVLWSNLVLYSLPLFVVQTLQQARGDLLVLAKLPVWLRIILYGAALALIVILGVRQSSEFIYVQF